MERIIIKAPGEKPETVEYEQLQLKDMQEIVGGYIEVVNIGNNVVMVLNEEGKLEGLKPNIGIRGDVIVGTIFFCGTDEEDMIGLTDEQISNIYVFLLK